MGEAEKVQFLLELKHTLEDLIVTRNEQMDQIKKEVDFLNQQLIKLTQQITSQSFTSADSLLDHIHKKNPDTTTTKPDTEDIASSSVIKKIFSSTNEILAHFQYENEAIFIRFPQPELTGFTPEKYINSFVRETLVKLRQSEPGLTPKLTKKQIDGQEYVETITITKITQFESFEIIFEAIKILIK